MSKKVIGVDVDLTVCATDKLWLQWLNKMQKEVYYESIQAIQDEHRQKILSYNLSDYYPIDNGLDFFRGSSIYDFAIPVEYARHVLHSLKGVYGFDIVFISTIKGNHHKSKYNWLKRYFEFLDGVIFTKEKHYIGVDYMIEDRVDMLNKFPLSTQCILLDTPYKQAEVEHRPMYKATDWFKVEEFILKTEGVRLDEVN